MRILVVEDELQVADLIKRALEEDNHAVDLCFTGNDCLEMVEGTNYDLIVLDIMLPGLNGFDVIHKIRHEEIKSAVIMVTSRNEVGDRVKGLDLGADDYLVKPFAIAELKARCRAMLRRNAGEANPLLKVGDLSLNQASKQVLLANESVQLTNREFSILEYLMLNKGHLLSKGMIAEHVWQYDFREDYNIIEVYIKRIRKKVEPVGRPKLIHTIRKGGYRIQEYKS